MNTKINWPAIRAEAGTYLSEHDDTLARAQLAISPLFDSMWERTKRPVQRRPNISLRLIADGEKPRAKLIILPYWKPQQKIVESNRLYFELVTEEVRGVNREWSKQVTFYREAAGLIRPSVVADLQRSLETLETFLADTNAVLARSHGNCCICGRALTDELSRSRGIGPECIKIADVFVYITEKSVVVPA